MFTQKELAEDASLLLDLKEDVREECESLGEVTNVVLYDVRTPPSTSNASRSLALQAEPEGIMTVKFRDPLSAQACVIVSLFDLFTRPDVADSSLPARK